MRDKILELKGEQPAARGIGGLRRKPKGRRGAPSQAERGMEAPAPYGRKKWRK